MKASILFFTVSTIVPALGVVSDVPGLNGPVPVVPFSEGMKKRPSDFVHPGLWHTTEDLELLRNNALAGVEPWSSAYQAFKNDSYSSPTYQMLGPKDVISRGSISNYSSFQHDARAAYQNAIMWYVTKEQSHWTRATTILDAWGSNLTNIIGTDRSLLVGLDGDIFVNAAEIMRWTGNWTEVGATWTGGHGFSVQLYWLFARQSIIIGQANYGMASIKGLLSFAAYLDDVSLWNYAINAYKYDPCAGIHALIDDETGQNAESGRDQGHAMVGVGWSSLAARTAGSQGYDLFSYADGTLFKGAEYLAKYNLNETVPYDPKFYRCEAVLVDGPWNQISNINRGLGKEVIWDLLYYEASSRGEYTPWVDKAKAFVDAAGGEGHKDDNDLPSWGNLLWARPVNGTARQNGTTEGGR